MTDGNHVVDDLGVEPGEAWAPRVGRLASSTCLVGGLLMNDMSCVSAATKVVVVLSR